ncbi:MAG: hypothetical protein R3F35_10215 [Myxococcota bacterium]
MSRFSRWMGRSARAESRSTARHTTLARAALALPLALAIALSAGTGCMVMDELDSAAAKMPSDKSKKQDPKRDPSGESLGAAGRLAAAKSALDERSKQWWQEAKTMTPGESKPAGVVRCRMSDGLRFMAKDDCLVQGGRVDG